MKTSTMVEHIERLEDQLQALKWLVKFPQTPRRLGRSFAQGIVAETAGLLRGRLPNGRTYQRRLRREWESRFKRES